MTSKIVEVVQQAGLVESETVDELRRWGAPIKRPSPGPDMPPEIVPSLIDRAMQEEEFVKVKETDLEVLRDYFRTQRPGELKMETPDGSVEFAEVSFGKSAMGEYIIPWVDENIMDVMGDCLVSLSWPDMPASVQLKNPKELYYGDRKMFVIWSVAT